jgi:tRNA pseudouridine38-40 synthase
MFPSSREHSEKGRDEDRRLPRTFRLSVAYDGTDYFGWQVQPGLPTIQGTLAAAVREVTGEEVLPQGSGRTDTGVHASAQAVSLVLQAAIPAERLHRALNRRLPAAIRVVSLADAPMEFHARAAVENKTYEYRLFQRRSAGNPAEHICSPQQARFVWDCRWPLRLDAMQRAAADLIGSYDFTSFAATDLDRTHRAQDPDQPLSNVRSIFRSAWLERDGLLIYRVTGSGFLHHMVRNIVGTCVEMGAGRMPADSIPSILRALDRRQAGTTAPPQGLHLVQVIYKGDHAPYASGPPAAEGHDRSAGNQS